MPELKKYINVLFVDDDIDIILFKCDLNKKNKKIQKKTNSYLNKIQYLHYFSIYNNNKLNQINNFNIKYQNQNIYYIKIINKKLFLRILKENKAIIVINAQEAKQYKFLGENFINYSIQKVKLNGKDTNVNGKQIYLEVGEYVIEVIFNSVTNGREMFLECKDIISIDLSNIQFSNNNDIYMMFYHCDNLKFLDLSNFSTSEIGNTQYNIQYVFAFCNNLKYINLYNFTGNKNIFEEAYYIKTICINNEQNPAVQFFPNAERNCSISIVQLKINFCMKIKNIKYGLYINDNIVRLNKIDACNWSYDINWYENNFTFRNILYKNNTILRMNSKSINLNITNIIETEDYTLNNHTYSPKMVLEYNFSDFIADQDAETASPVAP